jgi:SAM-dependent methyltransferase
MTRRGRTPRKNGFRRLADRAYLSAKDIGGSAMASFWDRYVVTRLIACGCARPSVMQQRVKVVPLAAGRVLELGVGSGINLAFYDPAKVSEVIAIDPSPELRELAGKADRPTGLKVSIEAGKAESLPFEDHSFDCVVSTFTLCSVASQAEALAQARRVLKPGGRLLFCEHGLSPDEGLARWQRRIDPVWKRLTGGCHLSRPITDAVTAAGFEVGERQGMYMIGAPRIAGWSEWGVGLAPA